MVSCDIFCRVIDNFGDAGVAWRLARSLSLEAGWKVRLVIDDPATLACLVPQLGGGSRLHGAFGVTVEPWDDEFESSIPERLPADVVVEAFSCFLPERYEAAIARRAESSPAAVFALEYLTAEPYAGQAHGLASPHPRYGYPKRFFFPGFTGETGGLIRETGLEDRRRKFLESGDRRAFLQSLGADPGHPFTLYLFTYPTVPVAALASQVAADPRPAQVILAPGEASDAFARALRNTPCPHLHLIRAPMLPQDDFDKALWSADAAIVRGEDSAVRAQLAGTPMIWTLYPQQEETHLRKLSAFASLYGPFLQPGARESWQGIESGLNGGCLPEGAWSSWRNCLPALSAGAAAWRDRLLLQPSLTEKLLTMAVSGIKLHA